MSEPVPPAPVRSPAFDEEGDASRRTWLANERTMLAWMRTGLAASAVAIAVGRIVPELSPHRTRWPYVVLGVGYGLLAVAVIAYGMRRRHVVDAAIRDGQFARAADRAVGLIGGFAIVLAIGTVLAVVATS